MAGDETLRYILCISGSGSMFGTTARRICFFDLVLVGMVFCYAPALAASASYFDMTENESENITPFYKWTTMIQRFDAQNKIPDSDCDTVRFHPCSILEWKALLDSLRDSSLDEKMDRVNTWANNHPYIVDQINWGMEDFWETPYEFMEMSGNCKDYAIAKYYSLKALGISTDDMRVIVLQDLNLGGVIHAVLGVYVDGELLILDNQNPRVTPALKIYHYRPIFGINENAWWAYQPNNP